MERVDAHPAFNAIKASSLLIEKSNEKLYSLELSAYRDEQKKIRDAFKKIDESNKELKPLLVKMLDSDEKRLSSDNDKLERRKQWVGYLTKDIYVNETSQIVSDMIKQGVLVKGN
jgi:hypothetical protein